MSVGNIRLAWYFPCDPVRGGEILTATSEAGNMVKENLVNHQPGIPYRSTSTAAQVFTGRLGAVGETHLIRFLLLYTHNLSAGAVIRLELSRFANFAVIDTDKTWGYSYPAYGFGLYPFGLAEFGIGQRIGGEGYNPFLLEFFENEIDASYYRLTITDTNNTDGYIQIGRMAMGDYWEPAINCDWGYTQDRTEVGSRGRESRSGAWWERPLPQVRPVKISFSALSVSDEQELDLLKFQAKGCYNILFSAYPGAGGEEERRHVVLGFKAGASGISRDNVHWRSSELTIREAV